MTYQEIHKYVIDRLTKSLSYSMLSIPTKCTKYDMSRYGIYMLKNHVTGCIYIGQTKRPFIQRWLEHQGDLSKGKVKTYLGRSFLKHDISKWEFSIIEYLPENMTIHNDVRIYGLWKKIDTITDDELFAISKWLDEKEIFYIRKYRDELGERKVYNENDGGSGLNPTKEVRQRLSQSLKELYASSPERIEHLRQLMLEKYKDPEQRKIISEKLKKAYKGLELKQRISEQRRGKPKSDKWKDSARKAQQKRYEDPNEHDKISIGIKRTSSTTQVKESRSKGQKERFKNQEQRNKISDKLKGREISWSDKVASGIRDKWKDPKYRERILKSRKENAARIMRCVDFALAEVYMLHPSLRYTTKKHKIEIMNKILKIMYSSIHALI